MLVTLAIVASIALLVSYVTVDEKKPAPPPVPPQPPHVERVRREQYIRQQPQQPPRRPQEAYQPPRLSDNTRRVNEPWQDPQDTSSDRLRERAKSAGKEMARYARESKTSYAMGDYTNAKALSEQSKAFRTRMESLNRQASELIFKQNNMTSKPGEADLHGLYVEEAIIYADRAIDAARQRGMDRLRLIVGKGTHNQTGVSRLRPAIEEHVRKLHLVAALDPRNAGVLVVKLEDDYSYARYYSD